jgi:hypothetical protein
MNWWIEALGWMGAAATFSAYSCRTMLPLRAVAVTANAAFISYGYLAGVVPMLVLHAALLPLNAVRLVQLLRLRRRARAARGAEDEFGWIARVEAPRDYPAGTRLITAGAPADDIYYLVEGRVRVVEAGRTLGPGTLFGEIAFFSETRRRTASVDCETDCRIVALDEARFMSAFHQDPSFGLAILRLVARRLIENADGPGPRPAPGTDTRARRE